MLRNLANQGVDYLAIRNLTELYIGLVKLRIRGVTKSKILKAKRMYCTSLSTVKETVIGTL